MEDKKEETTGSTVEMSTKMVSFAFFLLADAMLVMEGESFLVSLRIKSVWRRFFRAHI